MSTVQLIISTEEAAILVAALGFIRMNLAFNPDKALWQFVPGKSISYDLAQVISLEDMKSKIFEAYSEALETHPFNPYVKVY